MLGTNKPAEKLIVDHLFKKFSTLMKSEGSQDLMVVPILSHMKEVHTLPFYNFKISFNLILLSMPESSKWSVFIRLSQQNSLCSFLIYACHLSHPFHAPLFDHHNNYKSYRILLCSFLQIPITSSLGSRDNLLTILFLYTSVYVLPLM